MALHTDLPIYRTGAQLLGLAVSVQEQMPRNMKRFLGENIVVHCVDMLDLMALANASQHEARAGYIEQLLTRHRAVTSAPALIPFTPRVQQLCAAHGQWARGQPQRALAAALGSAKRFEDPRAGYVTYECDRSQVDALLSFARHLREAMTAAGCSHSDGAAAGQWRRRIRESSRRAAQAVPVSSAQATTPSVDLFALPPTEAQALAEYRRQVMKSLRDLVDFSQSSAY